MPPKNFWPKNLGQKILKSQIFMTSKIFIDTIYRGKLYKVGKLPQKFGPEKNFFINKKLSENFIDLSFIRNLGSFTKKCQKKWP